MSHFTVTVKLSAERLMKHKNDVDSALNEILAPYNEATSDPSLTEFVDVTDEYSVKYASEAIEQVRLDDGTFVWPYDERFRVKDTFGTGRNTHKAPEDKLVNRSAEEVYGSFENYMKEYCGYKKNSKGRYGYSHNPNAKWDWWVIGGRWTGHFPLKKSSLRILGESGSFNNLPAEGHGDLVKVGDIDLDAVAQQAKEQAKNFFLEYQELLQGKTFLAFDGPRSTALRLGLIKVVESAADAGLNEVAVSWASFVSPDNERATWTDLCKVISLDEFLDRYTDCFNPIATYAVLDDEGWHAPGEMGWFGLSTDSSDDYVAFKKAFMQRVIKSAKPDDTLVCVDCHI